MINKPPCHVFTGTSANKHGHCAHDIHSSTHVFTVLMKHTKSLTLPIQTHVTNSLVFETDVHPVLLFCLKYLHLSITYNAL